MPKNSSGTIRTSKRDPHADLPGRKINTADKGRAFVFYGRAGSGKTTLAATFPRPMLYLDIRDRGTDSISDVIKEKDVTARELETFAEFEDTYWWLKKHPGEFGSVIVDTVTQLQQLLLKEIAVEKGKDPESVGDWGSLTRKDWGEVSGTMKEWLTNYRDLTDLGMDVAFLAQDRVFNLNEEEEAKADEGMIIPEVGPAVIKSIAQSLNASVHFIGNTFLYEQVKTKEDPRGRNKKKETRETQYRLRVGPSKYYLTKVRKPKGAIPPTTITDPTYDDIMAIIRGE